MENVFRDPLPHAGIEIKQRVWNATVAGKDNSRGDLTLTATKEKLWISNVASIPLAWFTSFEPVGPGFRIIWLNKVSAKEESATFCIRTFFGYDTVRRDQLLQRLSDLAARARERNSTPLCSTVTGAVCEQCGVSAVLVDLPKITNFLVYWIRRTDRRILCVSHARSAIRANAIRNTLMGTVGIPGVFATPRVVWQTAAPLSRQERLTWAFIAALPGALLLLFSVWALALNM